MNVLLTGGTGYIASHAAVVLMQMGHQVVLYDNLSNSSDGVLTKLTQITNTHISSLHLALLSIGAIESVAITNFSKCPSSAACA